MSIINCLLIFFTEVEDKMVRVHFFGVEWFSTPSARNM
jgi:hypothetical protein